MPELESSSIGGLGKYAGLASLAGINLSDMTSSDAVRPDLYPNVINNTSFFLFLLDQNIKTSEGEKVKFKDFYYKVYEVEDEVTGDGNNNKGFIETVRGWFGIEQKKLAFKNNLPGEVIYLSKTKGEVIEELMEKITANMDKKTGIISISAKLPDPLVAAQVAQLSMNYLTDFVTKYRTEKSRKDVEFLAGRLSEAKSKYYSTQAKKAQYSDQFSAPTIRLQTADIQRERIESDYRVNSSFYQELLQQYETARLKVQQETPVFKILQNPVIPYKKSGPRRLIMIVGFSVLGAFFGIFWIIFKKNKFREVFIYK